MERHTLDLLWEATRQEPAPFPHCTCTDYGVQSLSTLAPGRMIAFDLLCLSCAGGRGMRWGGARVHSSPLANKAEIWLDLFFEGRVGAAL